MEKLKEIIQKNKMSTRPEYYSGRGATISDLSSEILFGIHNDLISEYGEVAGKGFIKMVAAIEVLSATAFLNGLYSLYYNEWEWVDHTPSNISIPKDKDGNHNVAIGMVSVMSSMMCSGRNDTARIRNQFLLTNGVKPQDDTYVNVYGY